MRIITSCIFLCLFNFCSAQLTYLPQGTYITPPGYDVFEFKIDSVGQFSCVLSSCTGQSIGRGRAFIYNNQLFFHYSDSVLAETECFLREPIDSQKPDSILAVFNIYATETGIPIEKLKTEILDEHRNSIVSSITDQHGVVRFYLPRKNGMYICRVYSEIFQSVEFTFDSNQSIRAEIFPKTNQHIPLNSSSNINWKICKMTDDKITLQFHNSDKTFLLTRKTK